MFTGLIQQRGLIHDLQASSGDPESRGVVLTIDAPGFATAPARGDSIAVDGCCLTVATEPISHETGIRLQFDVVPRTLEVTNLGRRAVGDQVNLESALRVGDPIGGHFVQGHIDGLGLIDSLEVDGDDHRVWVQLPTQLVPLVIPRGSIAINGVSLTIAEVDGDRFSVALIPVTRMETTLGDLAIGDAVNLECDMITRSVVGMLDERNRS